MTLVAPLAAASVGAQDAAGLPLVRAGEALLPHPGLALRDAAGTNSAMSRARRAGDRPGVRGMRVTALLAALVFLVALAGEVWGAHGCRHHGVVPAGSFEDAAALAGLHEHDHAQEAEAAPVDDSAHAGPCLCVGACHGSAASPLPSVGPAVDRVDVGSTGSVVLPDGATPARLLLPYLLPYGNGPPRVG